MNILHTVQRYYPDTGGSEEVVKQLSERLASKGHTVTVATSATPLRSNTIINGVNIIEFNCSGNLVEGIYGEAEKFKNFICQSDFDIIMNYAAQIWSSDLVFDLLPTLRAKKVFVPCGYSRLKDPIFVDYYKKMPEVLQRYDKVIYLSPNYQDASFGLEHGLTNGQVIPNGADLSEFVGIEKGTFRTKLGLNDETLLINVSNHSMLKNHRFFWKCIGALPKVHTKGVMIGNSYFKWPKKWLKECYLECNLYALQKNVLLLENADRRTIAEALTDADIFIFGSKVECSPLVMFEAFASKTLFVTTDCGNVRDYEDIVLIVENVEQAVNIIRSYQENPKIYLPRIEKAYTLAQKRLNWNNLANEYEELYLSLHR